MNQNKAISILLLFCIAATFLNVVTAVEDVDIQGVKFNIPDGYEENEDQMRIVETVNNKTIFKFFFNDNNGIAIGVISSNNKNLSLPLYKMGYEKRTINDIEGFYNDVKNIFAYEKDGKIIEVSTTDKDLLKDVLVK